MGVLGDLLGGFQTALEPHYLLLAALGVTLGTMVGVLPGIGPAVTVALLLPLTYNFDPTGAFILFAGIYYGGMYGGSTTSILLNTPGESASVVTTIEGFAMAKRGRGGAALATAAVGSFVAGTISTVAITFLSPAIARIALEFQAADYFALMVLALLSVTGLMGRSLLRGMISLFLGLFAGMIGIDLLSGQSRLIFGVPTLLDGIDIVVISIGLFAVGEALYVASRMRHAREEIVPVEGSVWMTRTEMRRSWRPWLRGSALGFFFGTLPAGGAEIPTFLSYNMERRLSKHPEEFGTGAIEGVAGPEAANNGAFSGVLVPLLTLGIPTSATAAILLAAFQIYDLQPGPLLFERASGLIWALIASLYIGNLMLLVLNLPMVKLWVKLLEIPREILYTAILVLSTLGVYSISGNFLEVFITYVIGVVGFFMRRYDFPVAPVVLGVILGPQLEVQFRRALLVSGGDYSVFFTRPLSASILVLALCAMVLPHTPKLAAWISGRRITTERVVVGEGREN